MKAAFHTLGCKVNSYETQAILEQFEALGFEVVPYDQPADVYVVNTCSVTGEAARKSRQILNRAKKRNPDAVTVATGCYAQEVADKLADAADLIIGNNEKSKIAQLAVAQLLANNGRQKQPSGADDVNRKMADQETGETAVQEEIRFIDDLTHCTAYEEQEISHQGNHVRAYVKIQDGCNRFCSYCIIPYLRGRSRSRGEEEILAEVHRLAQAGYKEIVLTGIDISDFRLSGEGKSRNTETCGSQKAEPGGVPALPPEESLLRILQKLDQVDGIERIRLGSLEEGIATVSFIKQLANIRKLCPQFHLSLQSGSDTVLKRMNRHYTTTEFADTVTLLREMFDNPAITTDIITGFPGETEEEFAETLAFVKQIRFASVHVFKYSRREGTAADRMNGQHTDKTKTARSEQLLALTGQLQRDYRESFIGKTRPVLIEEKEVLDGLEFQVGYTPEYFKIKIRSEENLINRILDITITGDMLAAEP